ncbi:MAG: tRNA dihydrouridine(20/20a) synthase DusA [Leptospirales bacterium]|nr:tRNA dihydrouridine(20/20a) synthase DusA [Leptospirales bacterium]
MMEVTDRYFRLMLRWISREVHLYTEMVHARAVLADPARFLSYAPEEHPVILQLGGDSPADLAEAAKLGAQFGYDEINLNCGCPSDRVQRGGFGACLMADPDLVGRCISAMSSAGIPVTVKHRIGISDSAQNLTASYAKLRHFVQTLFEAGCTRFIVHARLAILGGLSPAENRSVPPLNYEMVQELVSDFPDAAFEINGGIRTIAECEPLMNQFDGVMIGRAVRDNPMMLAGADIFLENFRAGSTSEVGSRPSAGNTPVKSRDPFEIVQTMAHHIEESPDMAHLVARHMLNVFHSYPGARAYRRFISENLSETEHKDVPDLLREALKRIEKKSEQSGTTAPLQNTAA